MMRLFVSSAFLASCTLAAQTASMDDPLATGFRVELAGQLDRKSLREVSGMAASRRRDDLFWVHNDSGSGPFLYPINSRGERQGKLKIRGATSHDWEDMASFDYDGKPMLLIADVGDNGARRGHVWFHVIEEPVVTADGLAKGATTDVAWSQAFRYPQGPADCEAVAVDVEDERVLLLTKRQRPPRLYSLPLRPPRGKTVASQVLTAEFLGNVETIPAPSAEAFVQDPVFGVYRSQPTAMDLAGRQLLVLTYGDAYLYQRAADVDWAQALAGKPAIILLPRMKQGESLAFDRAGTDAYVTSEKRPAPLYRLVRETQQKSKP